MPTDPVAKLDVTITGGGSKETEKLADLLGSVTEVAVNVAMLVELMVTGAL